MLKIRRSRDRLIFNMGSLYWYDDIFIETTPWLDQSHQNFINYYKPNQSKNKNNNNNKNNNKTTTVYMFMKYTVGCVMHMTQPVKVVADDYSCRIMENAASLTISHLLPRTAVNDIFTCYSDKETRHFRQVIWIVSIVNRAQIYLKYQRSRFQLKILIV